jgi:predicted phosphodiesterase
MKKITLLGDVHGKYKRMHEIIREKDKHEYIVQVGDLGFSYDTLDNVDPNKFKIVSGNHDNMDKIINTAHYLGNYGYTELNGINFFWYRGAYSIDRQYRTIGIDYWSNEENDIETFMKARELYREVKPDLVLTHDCPESIVYQMLSPNHRIYQNITNWALQELFNIHQPKRWFFGHHHQSKTIQYGNTKFICLDELEIYSLVKDEY